MVVANFHIKVTQQPVRPIFLVKNTMLAIKQTNRETKA